MHSPQSRGFNSPLSGPGGVQFTTGNNNSPQTARFSSTTEQISPATYSNYGGYGNMASSSGNFGLENSGNLTNSRNMAVATTGPGAATTQQRSYTYNVAEVSAGGNATYNATDVRGSLNTNKMSGSNMTGSMGGGIAGIGGTTSSSQFSQGGSQGGAQGASYGGKMGDSGARMASMGGAASNLSNSQGG